MVKQTALTVLMKWPDVFATRLASLLAKLHLQILNVSHEWLSVMDVMTVTMAVMKALAGTILYQNKFCQDPAVVAWLAKASLFHSVNSAFSANGGLNPAVGTKNCVLGLCYVHV